MLILSKSAIRAVNIYSKYKLYCVLEVRSDSYVAACSDKIELRKKSLFIQLLSEALGKGEIGEGKGLVQLRIGGVSRNRA